MQKKRGGGSRGAEEKREKSKLSKQRVLVFFLFIPRFEKKNNRRFVSTILLFRSFSSGASHPLFLIPSLPISIRSFRSCLDLSLLYPSPKKN